MEYDPAGYVLFVAREGDGGPLLAQRLDLDREELVGDAFQVVERTFTSGPGEALFSVGPGGLLAIREIASGEVGQLTWVSAEGEVEQTVGPAGIWGDFDLSPDASTVAISRPGEGLWLIDTRRGAPTRIADGDFPVWSPDGRRLAFVSGGPPNPFVLDVTAGGEARRVAPFPKAARPTDWTPGGAHLVVAARVENSAELLLVPLDGGEIETLVRGDAPLRSEGRVSPSGRWLAFLSEETGDPELYVTRFPRAGRRWRTSTGGASGPPRWSADGTALYYQHQRQIVRVTTDGGGETFRAGDPKVVFEHDDLGAWDLAPNGRLLVALGTGERVSPPLIVITDWRAAAGID